MCGCTTSLPDDRRGGKNALLLLEVGEFCCQKAYLAESCLRRIGCYGGRSAATCLPTKSKLSDRCTSTSATGSRNRSACCSRIYSTIFQQYNMLSMRKRKEQLTQAAAWEQRKREKTRCKHNVEHLLSMMLSNSSQGSTRPWSGRNTFQVRAHRESSLAPPGAFRFNVQVANLETVQGRDTVLEVQVTPSPGRIHGNYAKHLLTAANRSLSVKGLNIPLRIFSKCEQDAASSILLR